jgi:hypothetical protein
MLIPPSVLIKDTASEPASSLALAISDILVTLGDNFVIRHFLVNLLTSFTNPKVLWASWEINLSLCKFGQEIFNSMAATSLTSSRISVNSRNSSGEFSEAILTIIGTLSFFKKPN